MIIILRETLSLNLDQTLQFINYRALLYVCMYVCMYVCVFKTNFKIKDKFTKKIERELQA